LYFLFLTAKNILKNGDDNYNLSESTNKEKNGKEKSQKKPYGKTPQCLHHWNQRGSVGFW
jgi:hypothetical protein